jgi:hypothetical protein
MTSGRWQTQVPLEHGHPALLSVGHLVIEFVLGLVLWNLQVMPVNAVLGEDSGFSPAQVSLSRGVGRTAGLYMCTCVHVYMCTCVHVTGSGL